MAKGTLANSRSAARSIAVRFDAEMFKKLNAIANERGIPFAELVRRAVNYWDHGSEA